VVQDDFLGLDHLGLLQLDQRLVTVANGPLPLELALQGRITFNVRILLDKRDDLVWVDLGHFLLLDGLLGHIELSAPDQDHFIQWEPFLLNDLLSDGTIFIHPEEQLLKALAGPILHQRE